MEDLYLSALGFGLNQCWISLALWPLPQNAKRNFPKPVHLLQFRAMAVLGILGNSSSALSSLNPIVRLPIRRSIIPR